MFKNYLYSVGLSTKNAFKKQQYKKYKCECTMNTIL